MPRGAWRSIDCQLSRLANIINSKQLLVVPSESSGSPLKDSKTIFVPSEEIEGAPSFKAPFY